MNHAAYPGDIRHPDPIVRARALRDLAERHKYEYVYGRGQDFRDWLVERIGLPISGMTLNRYLRLLETPESVQRAVSARQLPMALASRVAPMPASPQQEIADQIGAGQNARHLVSEVAHRPTQLCLPLPGTPVAREQPVRRGPQGSITPFRHHSAFWQVDAWQIALARIPQIDAHAVARRARNAPKLPVGVATAGFKSITPRTPARHAPVKSPFPV